MSFTNKKPSEAIAVLDAISPVSQGAGTATTSWVSAANYHRLLATVMVGAFGASATVDAKIQQATSSGGAGAKDVTGAAITQMLAAGGNNKQALINVDANALDSENGFVFVQLSITVGTAATLIAGLLEGFTARFEPVTQPASVTQVIG